MTEAAKEFIGKDCVIYLLSGTVTGVITEVCGRAIKIKSKTEEQLINLDFVLRIQEYPRNKNGKKKMLIVD